jgi:Kyakuja-Dileera-Zisupton transposase
MGDLQKGERYANLDLLCQLQSLTFASYSRYSNMDYLLLSSVMNTTIKSITISYDIACQWGKNFTVRTNNPTLPDSLRLPSSTSLQFIVPKFHLPAHIPKCHGPFSFNYASGVGRTDGEGIERNWSVLNGIAPSVSMMGPGGRWDTLDDVCNFMNWRKTISLCE